MSFFARTASLNSGFIALTIGALAYPSASAAQTNAGVLSTPASTPDQASRGEARKLAREARRADRRRIRAIRDAQRQGVDRAAYTGADGTEIVVVGLRKSVAEAVRRRRTSRQIVDSVVAEDAGKLPDNNVVEALARVTGISITRSQGQGDGITIRGLADVQTTVNGTDLAGAGGRSLSLSSIPAELIKAVDVYKSRSADQIEGGIAGTVNIELRRPLDLKKGWTVAGSMRESYNSQGSTWSPFASLLIGKRFDTGIGEIGFLLNGGYQQVKYNEAYNTSESPFRLFGTAADSLPAGVDRETTVAPYLGQYGVDRGKTTQPSLSGVIQWRPSSQLNFVLEGSYFGSTNEGDYSRLFVRAREDYYTIQNPRIAPSGVLLGYDIVNVPPATGTPVNFGQVRAGTVAGARRNQENLYRTNFETHWEAPGIRIDGGVQYAWSNIDNYDNGYETVVANTSRIGIDFNSSAVPGGGPSFNFYGRDLTDASQLNILSLSDNYYKAKNTQFAANVDLWKEVSSASILRSVQFGTRYSRNTNDYGFSYRYAGWFDPARQPVLTSFSAVDRQIVTPAFRGGTSTSWAQLNARQLFNNWDAARQFIIANNPEFLDGPGRDNGAAAHFAADRPNSEDPVNFGGVRENVFAAYGTLNYAFRAGIPIDGNLGLRYANTWASLEGRNLISGQVIRDAQGRPILDAEGNQQFAPFRFEDSNSRANYVDLLPSAFLMAHFTDKFQLRASYSHNVQRPDLGALRAYRNINYSDSNAEVYAGNPALNPTTTDDFNVALEWYFGRAGLISVTGFIKNQTGFIYETRIFEPVVELGGALRYVRQPRNAGPGTTRGVEAAATGFFTFLPGFLKNFGGTANVTWIPRADIQQPRERDAEPGVYDLVTLAAPYTSRVTYNLIGYYETPVFSARVAYNRRSSFKTGADAIVPFWVQASHPTSRLDAAINFTPVPFLTLSVEAQNILRAQDRFYYDQYPELPVGLRQMGRTIQMGARFRF